MHMFVSILCKNEHIEIAYNAIKPSIEEIILAVDIL